MSYTNTRDFYRILRVPHTASLEEIKVSYRKLALRLHPDMHKNDPAKSKEFKLVNEAYDTLSDSKKKSSYDFEIGNSFNNFNRSRATPPPPNYRKVYSPRPPPEWKTVWDHELHFEMHYGEGMKREAIRQARKQAQAEGLFDYKSKIGKGFTFSDNKEENINPFSKAVQGPPTVVFDYEEGYQDSQSSKEAVRKRDRVVEDLHGRREARHMKMQAENLHRQQQRYNSAFARRSENECVIL